MPSLCKDLKAAPNNSFKPTPHRGVNSVLYATLHAVAAPLWGGLTLALAATRIHMSFDIFVFNHTNAPRDAPKFLKWYDKLTDWSNDIDYNNPENASDALRSWLDDMVQSFPPLNGPLAMIDSEGENLTDYSIGGEFIYSAFPWSSSESARELALQFAAKHSVGFFDTSAEPGLVLFPDGHRFNAADALKSKPWWRFW